MLNWAIIGSGDVVNRLVQDSIVSKQSKVKYIYSYDQKNAKKLCKIFGYGKVALSLKTISDDKTINCVYIATPPDSHFKYINYFSKKKINIVCEKPLILKKAELVQLNKILKKKQISFFCSFYRREQNRFKYIKNLLKKKVIGKIISFDYKMHHSLKSHPTAPIQTDLKSNKKIPWRFDKKKSGGGNFFDMGLHVVDFMIDIFGECKKFQVLKSNSQKLYNVEETSIINFSFKNNIIGQCAWRSTVTETLDKFKIYGEKGTIEFSFNFDNLVLVKLGNKIIKKSIKFSLPTHKPIFSKILKDLTKSYKSKTKVIDKKSLKISKLQIEIANA
jgi:predicted dehydrogenase